MQSFEQNSPWHVNTALQLLGPLGDRWLHVQKVGCRAEQIAEAVSGGDALVAAAWLHDIGYSPEIADTGFHPLDGARYLRAHGADELVVALVARITPAPTSKLSGAGWRTCWQSSTGRQDQSLMR